MRRQQPAQQHGRDNAADEAVARAFSSYDESATGLITTQAVAGGCCWACAVVLSCTTTSCCGGIGTAGSSIAPACMMAHPLETVYVITAMAKRCPAGLA
jgi:hypothetical protein